MSHLNDDIQIFLVLAGGGSLTALGISRVRYDKDWFYPWLTFTKVLCALALAVIAVGEHRALSEFWAAAPILLSISSISSFSWLMTRSVIRRKAQGKLLDLNLAGATNDTPQNSTASTLLYYWGVLTLLMLMVSFLVALVRR